MHMNRIKQSTYRKRLIISLTPLATNNLLWRGKPLMKLAVEKAVIELN
jgi:hypothetical protein